MHGQPHQRREVDIPSLEDSLLSMCVKCAGGVVVSFNGRLVTRFNLAESFDASLEAIPLHDGSLFHIILSSVGAKADKNVMVLWIIHIKPSDEETDLKALFEKIRAMEVKGCKWGETCNIKPLAFGINFLEISCVIEDDVCSEDDVIDAIMQFEDEVQSTEIVSFSKISYS